MRMTDDELRLPSDLPYDKAPPWKIKSVEYSKPTMRQQRKELLKKHGWSSANLPAEYIYIYMVTDSGTGAMSDRQWSAMMLADESYFFCKSWYNFEEAVKYVTGLEYILPCHQGRSGEAILYETLVSTGDIVPSNTHFTTTRAHAYAQGAEPLDLLCEEYAAYPQRTDLFKGNINLAELEKVIIEHGDRIPFVEMVMPNNLNGGQPVSMENLKKVKEILKARKIPLGLDIARLPENAYLIKSRQKGYSNKSCVEIVREACSYADFIHMSSKKCGLVNIGGFVAVKSKELYERLQPKLIRTDGFITYGGLSGRDLEATAVGLLEGVNDYYLQDRQRQIDRFAEELRKREIPIYEPPGCFVFIDAGRCLPHLKPIEGPATSLASQAYIEGGVGITPFDSLHRAREDSKDPLNENKLGLSPFELIRCAIPRRVFTDAHLEVAADAIRKAVDWGKRLPAYKKVTVERPALELKDIGLRPFFDEFEPVTDHP
jgi:tryptophanase